ncbi:sexual development protein [Biscogniauxia sp. FL1348]|nr:sexual development protein [Biscogniauxia sp. FL1348]
MRTSILIISAAVLGLVAGYAIPSDDGFPDPNAQQLLSIETEADGLLSNLPPPPTLSEAGITNFQLIAFNENFEVAFFSSLIENITNSVPGFDMPWNNWDRDALLEILKTVKAQEELHAITATTTLAHFNATLVPSPCTYKFPTDSLESAIGLAETFTALVLGTLQDAVQSFARGGDDGPARAVAAVVGQEGEQSGFYRLALGRKPSAKPFLTTAAAALAFSALLQRFVVECPFDVARLPIPVFPPLDVLLLPPADPPTARDANLTFAADLSGLNIGGSGSGYGYGNGSESGSGSGGSDVGGLFVTYLVGQQRPISVPIANPRWDGGVLTFDALFPFTENVMEGLSIAALTNASDFDSAEAMVARTLAAPGLIQVNDLLPSSSSQGQASQVHNSQKMDHTTLPHEDRTTLEQGDPGAADGPVRARVGRPDRRPATVVGIEGAAGEETAILERRG